MNNLKLVKFNNPILRSVSERYKFNQSLDMAEFSQELIKFLYDNNGLNVTGPQIGMPYRIIALKGHPENFVMFNPIIVDLSEQEVILDETSLTYPGISIKIKRPLSCRVRFTTPNQDVRTEKFNGITARVFQQSMDFLDGKLFYSTANPIHKEQALRKWRRLKNH